MITASDLRPGATVERDGDLFEVIDFSHMKQGRGTAVIRAKLRNVTTGAVTDETFRPEEKFGKVRIERSEAQFSYKDGENYVVMDSTTYDQITLSPEQLGSAVGLSAALLVLRLTPREVSREQFLIEVRQGQLKKATIYPQDHLAVADYGNPGAIRTVLAEDDQTFAAELRALGVDVTFGTSDSVSP